MQPDNPFLLTLSPIFDSCHETLKLHAGLVNHGINCQFRIFKTKSRRVVKQLPITNDN